MEEIQYFIAFEDLNTDDIRYLSNLSTHSTGAIWEAVFYKYIGILLPISKMVHHAAHLKTVQSLHNIQIIDIATLKLLVLIGGIKV